MIVRIESVEIFCWFVLNSTALDNILNTKFSTNSTNGKEAIDLTSMHGKLNTIYLQLYMIFY